MYNLKNAVKNNKKKTRKKKINYRKFESFINKISIIIYELKNRRLLFIRLFLKGLFHKKKII